MSRQFETVIFGAGGAGRTTAAILLRMGKKQIAFLEDAPGPYIVNNIQIVGTTIDRGRFRESEFIIAFGTRHINERLILFKQMRQEGYLFDNAFDPQSYIDNTVSVGVGNVIAAGVRVLPNAQIGSNCFFCVNSSVDHDCQVMDGAYLAPGATLAGGVVIEEGAFIGANATILPKVRIGQYATVGAGAVVTRDVPPHTVVIGMPAK